MHSKRRKILLAISPILASGLLIAALASSSASAASGCNNHSLRGGYGGAISGSVWSGGVTSSEVGDLAGAARLTFDGQGSLVGAETDSFNGNVSSYTSTGTYTINADCTGTATIVNSNSRTDHINIILVDGGDQFAFVDTDPGAVLAGTFTKQ